LKDQPEIFPKVVQRFQTEKQIRYYGLNEAIIQSLNDGNEKLFTERLGLSFYCDLHNLDKEPKFVKSCRDKILAHNDEVNKVEKTVFKDINKLLDFGWNVVTIIRWVYISTLYGNEGRTDLRQDIRVKGTNIEKLINKLITPHNRVDGQ